MTALATLASLAGPEKVAADLAARIAELDSEIAVDLEAFRHGGSIADFLLHTGRKVAIRDEARGRLAEIQGTEPDTPDRAAELLALMLSASRRAAEVVTYLRSQRALRLYQLERDLADARAAIVDLAATYKVGGWALPTNLLHRGRATQIDVALDLLPDKEAAAADLEARLALLGGAGAYGNAIHQAVEDAGGADAVVKGIQQALGAGWIEGSAGFAAYKAAAARVASVKGKLDATDPDSLRAAQFRQELTTSTRAAERARESAHQGRLKWANDLLRDAMRGAPAEGADLERIVASSPRSFPDGFAAAVARARSGCEEDLAGVVAEAIFGS